MVRYLRSWAAVAAVCLSGAHAAAQAEPRYTLTSLGDLGGGESRPQAINNRGQVVGQSRTATNRNRAFLWEDGVMLDLGVLNNVGAGSSSAIGINSRGQVVGSASTAFDGPSFGLAHAFVWEDGVMLDLGTLPGTTFSTSSASAINNRGWIVGTARDEAGANRPVIWRDGVISDLGTLPGGATGSATGINNRGQIVGLSQGADGLTHAVLWDDGDIIDLSPPGAILAGAGAINARGDVVGFFALPGVLGRATVWEDLIPFNLGTLPGDNFSQASGINNGGTIVGRSQGPGVGSRAVLFDPTGGLPTPLSPLVEGGLGLFRELTTATDVNEDGQIVGNGPAIVGNVQKAFLLMPIED
jgi:probable HAF family extracellular repeat protein